MKCLSRIVCLLKFCIEVLPFEPQGSQKVEDEPRSVNQCESGHVS